jgi:hypothetical protein
LEKEAIVEKLFVKDAVYAKKIVKVKKILEEAEEELYLRLL